LKIITRTEQYTEASATVNVLLLSQSNILIGV